MIFMSKRLIRQYWISESSTEHAAYQCSRYESESVGFFLYGVSGEAEKLIIWTEFYSDNLLESAVFFRTEIGNFANHGFFFCDFNLCLAEAATFF